MKEVILFGGGGYIGTVLCNYLLEKGYSVTIVDKFVYNNNHSVIPYLNNKNFTFIDLIKYPISNLNDLYLKCDGHWTPEGNKWAADIISRYKRAKGFNVLHPMGFDSFGLPAEQYAIKTGQHPKITTDKNIIRFNTFICP